MPYILQAVMRKIAPILFGLGLLFMFSCGESEPKDPKSEKHGGILKLEASVPLLKFYLKGPAFVGETAYLRFHLNEFEGLTRINPNTCKVEANLAKSWEVKKSGKVFIFHLKKNVLFSSKSSQPFSAYDVKKCFDTLCYSNGNVGYSKIHTIIKGVDEFKASIKQGTPFKEGIKGVEVLNDSTIKFTLQKEYVPFPQLLSDPNFTFYRVENGVFKGTGPFVLDTLYNGFMKYKRNSNYWKRDQDGYRLPYLDELHYISKVEKEYPNFVSIPLANRLDKFLNDDLHVLRAITADDIGLVMSKLRTENDKEFNYESIDYARLNGIAINNYMPPFNNPKVRKAFELAFDADLFVDSVLNGEGWPAKYGFMPPGLIAYEDTVRKKEFNVKKAKKLLAEAGYHNLETFPEVVVSSVRYNTSEGIVTKQFTQAIEMICAELGIKYRERVFDSYKLLFEANYKGDYMMCPYVYTTKIPSPEGYLNTFSVKIDTNIHDVDHDNIMFYRDSIFEKYYNSALKELNEEVRLEKFASAERRMFEKSPIIPLHYTEINRIVTKKVRGLSEINNLGIEDYTYTYLTKLKNNKND